MVLHVVILNAVWPEEPCAVDKQVAYMVNHDLRAWCASSGVSETTREHASSSRQSCKRGEL
jgi:hypothetical protein